MAVHVTVPTILRTYTHGEGTVEAAGSTLDELLSDLEQRYPGVTRNLREGETLRRFVNIYVNEEDARLAGSMDAPIADGDIVAIVPAVAGG